MKIGIVFVPPGGGEADYSLNFKMEAVPRPGDYISIKRGDEVGTEDFIVRRTWWHLHTLETRASTSADDVLYGKVVDVMVECEFARGHYSTDSHKRSCDMYQGRGKQVPEFEATAY